MEDTRLPAPSGANKNSFPRGAPMQHLAPRRNPAHFNPRDSDPYFTVPNNTARAGGSAEREDRCSRTDLLSHSRPIRWAVSTASGLSGRNSCDASSISWHSHGSTQARFCTVIEAAAREVGQLDSSLGSVPASSRSSCSVAQKGSVLGREKRQWNHNEMQCLGEERQWNRRRKAVPPPAWPAAPCRLSRDLVKRQ